MARQRLVDGDSGTKVALTSGRFDPPHPGHIISLQRLGQEYHHVIIAVLDYSEQMYPVAYRRAILEDVLGNSMGSYSVRINQTHFGKISKDELDRYNADLYIGGNLSVLRHIETLGMQVSYQDRSYQYTATDDRQWQSVKQVLQL